MSVELHCEVYWNDGSFDGWNFPPPVYDQHYVSWTVAKVEQLATPGIIQLALKGNLPSLEHFSDVIQLTLMEMENSPQLSSKLSTTYDNDLITTKSIVGIFQ